MSTLSSTDQILQELEDCAALLKAKDDSTYFALNYARLAHPKKDSLLLTPRVKQQELISIITNGESVMSMAARQTGQTGAIGAAILWKLLFTQERIVLFARNVQQAMEYLNIVRFAYDHLPSKWQDIYKVEDSTKTEFSIKGGGRIWVKGAASKYALRGHTLNTIMIMDAAFISNSIITELLYETLPLVSMDAQLVIATSGIAYESMFLQLWDDIDFDVRKHTLEWDSVPDRDDIFKQLVIQKIGQEQWNSQFELI